MASKVQICNLALSRLGGATITSLTDGSREANLCNTFYDDTAKEVMSSGAWSSTITRATLNKISTAPEWGFDSRFQLPTSPKMLKVISINELSPGQYKYRIEGDKLLINTSSLKIEYVGEITDTESYDEFLKNTIIVRLMGYLAYPITGDLRVVEKIEQLYERTLVRNLALDGQQGSHTRATSPDLINPRGDAPDIIE